MAKKNQQQEWPDIDMAHTLWGDDDAWRLALIRAYDLGEMSWPESDYLDNTIPGWRSIEGRASLPLETDLDFAGLRREAHDQLDHGELSDDEGAYLNATVPFWYMPRDRSRVQGFFGEDRRPDPRTDPSWVDPVGIDHFEEIAGGFLLAPDGDGELEGLTDDDDTSADDVVSKPVIQVAGHMRGDTAVSPHVRINPNAR